MIAFGWVTNMLQRGAASWKRMLEVMDTVPLVADDPRPAGDGPLPPIRGAIEIRGLTFGYDGAPVLRDVSLRVAAGETLAVVGPTGSGKSTLISLLPRLYEPPRGTIFIDGVDVRDIPLAALRGAIGFVAQEPFLFSDTLGANIAFGLEPAAAPERAGPISKSRPTPARPRRWSRRRRWRGSTRTSQGFPQGYDTLVGERGITLSGGQKQRTALARAVATDPRVLVLDDALSAVDTYTEEEILSRLRSVMRQRTSVVVSHRVSTVREADQIVVLDAGRIVERGRHEDLIALGGAYADLHRKQLLEEELEGER